jgi:hypothetical protein
VVASNYISHLGASLAVAVIVISFPDNIPIKGIIQKYSTSNQGFSQYFSRFHPDCQGLYGKFLYNKWLGIREASVANRAQLYKYKGNRCTSCGLSVQEAVKRFGTFDRVFELHHIDPGTKNPNFKNLVRRNLSVEQIEEVDKCTLLCSNCHSIIHAQNVRAKLKLIVSLEDREVSQEFDGSMICDAQEKTFTFVTNQRFKLQPVVIAFGNGGRLNLFAIELEKRDHLVNCLHNVKDLQGVEIFSRSGDDLYIKIEYLGYKKIRLTQKIGFPVFAFDLTSEGQHKNDVWMRNGFVLTKSGEVHTNGTLTCVCELP